MCKTKCTLARVPSVPHLWAEPAECSRQGTENGKGVWMWVGLSGKTQFQLFKQLPEHEDAANIPVLPHG